MESEKIIQLLIQEGKITEEELSAMIEEERRKSPLLPIQTDVDGLKESSDMAMIALADSYENQIMNDMARQEEGTASMTAAVELYELFIQLDERLNKVEEGGN